MINMKIVGFDAKGNMAPHKLASSEPITEDEWLAFNEGDAALNAMREANPTTKVVHALTIIESVERRA